MDALNRLNEALNLPGVKSRLIRAAVVTIRESGRQVDDLRPFSFELHGDSLAVNGSGGEIVRLPISDLATQLDA